MQQDRVRFASGSAADSNLAICRHKVFDAVGLRSGPDRALRTAMLLIGAGLAALLAGCGSILGGGLTASPGTLSFGGAAVGQAVVSSVTLSNTGNSTIRILQLSVSGQSFSVGAGASLPITIHAGGSYALPLQFTPVNAGQAAGQLTLNTDAGNGASATVKLNGTGLETFTSAPAAPTAVLSGISCGNSSMMGAGTDNCTVTLSAPAGGGGASVNLSSSNPAVTVPAVVTIAANATSAGFAARISAVPDPETATIVASTGGVQVSTSLQLDATTSAPASAPAAVLNGFSCASTFVMGPASVNCAVTLSSAAPSGGLAVALTSGNPDVVVPQMVTVPPGASSTGFTVTVSSVPSAQTASVTASANGIAENVTLRLSVAGPLLAVNATAVPFGNVTLSTPATQSILLQSVGSEPVSVNLVTLTGLGFSMENVGLPLTLVPGQSAILNVVFTPTLLGPATGLLTISSDSVNGNSTVVSLSGTGSSSTTYAVALTWDASASPSDPVAGYRVYRTADGYSYELLNSSGGTTATTFTDGTVQNGASYTYYVTSVDSTGVESGPSNMFAVTIP
jgi:hypothetical protein